MPGELRLGDVPLLEHLLEDVTGMDRYRKIGWIISHAGSSMIRFLIAELQFQQCNGKQRRRLSFPPAGWTARRAWRSRGPRDFRRCIRCRLIMGRGIGRNWRRRGGLGRFMG